MIARGILRRAGLAALTGLAVVTVTQAMGAFNGLSLAILIGGALAVISIPPRNHAR